MGLILASQSPRRHDILNWMGIPFETEVCDAPEVVPSGLSPQETVKALALQKAAHAFRMHPEDYVLGADTIVALDGVIYGKPQDKAQAKATLRALAGREHTVYTGVALLHGSTQDVRCCASTVRFRPMQDAEIDWYVSTGEPMDKAGAYGLQGLGCVFVEGMVGNYFNVIGLPAPTVYEMLLDGGFLTPDRSGLQ